MANDPPPGEQQPVQLTSPDKAEVSAPQVIPPLPPAPPGQQVSVALGMQLMQQSSLERLPLQLQMELVALAKQMDDHAFENAQESLRLRSTSDEKKLADRALGRKHVLLMMGAIGGAAMVAGTTITIMLVVAKQYQLAQTVMLSCLSIGSALLGGAGLTTLLQRLTSGQGRP